MTSTPIHSTTRVATVVEIRAQFPALNRMQEELPVAYFDGPGGTQVPRAVAEAMMNYLFHHNANTHWLYPSSQETDALIAAARETVADFLGAKPDEIVFGLNMTTLTFHLARAIGRGLKAGDEIVVTELDHHANVAPWRVLEQERGVTIRTVRMNPADGRIDWEDLERNLTENTRVLAIGAASNALGTITDARRATDMGHAVGAKVFIDAVHAAPHELVDVGDIDCDYLACSAYKFYGPHIGILYGRRRLLQTLDVPRLDPAPNTAPERMEPGTQNHEGIVGAAAAVEFLASLAGNQRTRREALVRSFEVLRRRGDALVERLWNGLVEIPGVTVFGPPPGTPRTPTVSFVVKGKKTDDVAAALAKRGVFVSNGDFYAATVIERLGQSPDGIVRVGCACYTTRDEIDRLLAGVREIAK